MNNRADAVPGSGNQFRSTRDCLENYSLKSLMPERKTKRANAFKKSQQRMANLQQRRDANQGKGRR